MSSENQRKKDLLKKVSIFEELEDFELDLLLPHLQKRNFKKGEFIVKIHDKGDSLYLVESGELKVTLKKKEREVILSLLKKGDFFGEMALLDHQPRSANVVALTKTELFELKKDDFQRFIEKHPKVLVKILHILSERLRQADMIIGDLAFLDVYGRVARLLLRIAAEEGTTTSEGTLIRKPPSQQQIAAMINASRETINRAIAELVRRGFVKKNGRQLIITAAELLNLVDGNSEDDEK